MAQHVRLVKYLKKNYPVIQFVTQTRNRNT
jgi:ribosomal protein L39E